MSSETSPIRDATFDLIPLAETDEYVHLACAGDLDFAALPAEGNPLAELIGPEGYTRRVLLNCERLLFLDTAGISWLIEQHKRFVASGGRLVLYAVPPVVEQLLKLLQLQRVLHVSPDLPAARALALGDKP